MSSEDLKAIVRRVPLEAFNKGDYSVIDQTLASNFVDHVGFGGLGTDRQAIKKIATMLRSAFPDFHYDIKMQLAEGNKVATLSETSATHKGEFMGIPATGKKATWTEIHFVRLEGDKIVEHWANVDQFSMMQQLGLVPAMGGKPSQPMMSKSSNMTPVAGMGEMFMPGGRTTSYQDNKMIVRRWLEQGFNHGDLAVVSQLFAPDFVSHDSTFPSNLRGHEAVKAFTSTILQAFPDCHITIDDQIAEGDMVFTRWSASGTHKGDFMGTAPTGKSACVSGMEFDRIIDGKMAVSWVVWDVVGLMQQLGMMQAPGSGR